MLNPVASINHQLSVSGVQDDGKGGATGSSGAMVQWGWTRSIVEKSRGLLLGYMKYRTLPFIGLKVRALITVVL